MRSLLFIAALFFAAAPSAFAGCGWPSPCDQFIRGDCDGDYDVDTADCAALSARITAGAGSGMACSEDAFDVNNDGEIDGADMYQLVQFTYFEVQAAAPEGPYPESGVDPDSPADDIDPDCDMGFGAQGGFFEAVGIDAGGDGDNPEEIAINSIESYKYWDSKTKYCAGEDDGYGGWTVEIPFGKTSCASDESGMAIEWFVEFDSTSTRPTFTIDQLRLWDDCDLGYPTSTLVVNHVVWMDSYILGEQQYCPSCTVSIYESYWLIPNPGYVQLIFALDSSPSGQLEPISLLPALGGGGSGTISTTTTRGLGCAPYGDGEEYDDRTFTWTFNTLDIADALCDLDTPPEDNNTRIFLKYIQIKGETFENRQNWAQIWKEVHIDLNWRMNASIVIAD